MFEKLITNLKKSLPEALRKKMGEADNLDDEEDFEDLKNDSNETSTGDLEEDSEEDKKKKMKSMIIKVIVILALGFFALDEFILKESPPSAGAENSTKVSRPKKENIVEVETTTQTPPTSEGAEPTKVSESEAPPTTESDMSTASTEEEMNTTPTSETVVSEAPPIENINVMEKTDDNLSIEPVAKIEDELPAQSEDQPEDQIISRSRMGESTVDKKLDDLVDNVEQTAPSNPIEEVKIPSSGESNASPSMVSKIVEEVIETLPPVYDQVGRGLVYNCKDKYWACLDKPAYVTCSKNQKFNKSKGNSAECVVSDIYSSDEDCAKIQKYNVSTNVSTAFCQN